MRTLPRRDSQWWRPSDSVSHRPLRPADSRACDGTRYSLDGTPQSSLDAVGTVDTRTSTHVNVRTRSQRVDFTDGPTPPVPRTGRITSPTKRGGRVRPPRRHTRIPGPTRGGWYPARQESRSPYGKGITDLEIRSFLFDTSSTHSSTHTTQGWTGVGKGPPAPPRGPRRGRLQDGHENRSAPHTPHVTPRRKGDESGGHEGTPLP